METNSIKMKKQMESKCEQMTSNCTWVIMLSVDKNGLSSLQKN
jgi:hypothetical protein